MLIIGDRKFLNTKEASRQFGLSVNWFRKKRWDKCGPTFVKLPKTKTVFYEFESLSKWLEDNLREEE